jgi:hypothetical protein
MTSFTTSGSREDEEGGALSSVQGQPHGVEEGLKHKSSIHCDDLVSIRTPQTIACPRNRTRRAPCTSAGPGPSLTYLQAVRSRLCRHLCDARF